jgi:acyl-CoA reductase-like NAD-dependent aldehyde dehydrogenase
MVQGIVDTPVDDIAGVIDAAAAKADEWKAVPLEEKIALLEQIKNNLIANIDEWASLVSQARGVDSTEPRHGQGRAEAKVCGGAFTGEYLTGLIATLEYIAANGVAPPPKAVRTTNSNKCIVTVFPDGILETIESAGMTLELVLDGSSPDQMSLDEVAVGGVVGVLGAGNYDAPLEALCEMFLKARVCVYKFHANAQAAYPALKKIFEPLLSAGYLSYVIGGAEQGNAITSHSAVDEIVFTGSMNTYNKIVWGSTEQDQKKNKAAKTPLVKKPICAELGSVNPWIVAPGEGWTDKLIDSHAQHLVFAKMMNNGHTCASPQILIVAKDWPKRKQFLDRVRYWFARVPGSPPFYPGSAKSHAHFKELENAELIQGEVTAAFKDQQLPVLVGNVTNSELLQEEAFCPVIAEVPLDFSCNDTIAFLRAAVDFAAKEMFGSLSLTMIIDDNAEKENAKEIDRLVADAPFGRIGINVWAGFGVSNPALIWGAFRGTTDSGSGFFGNANLYRSPEKTVLHAPFDHPARVGVRSAAGTELVLGRLTAYKVQPSFWRLAKLLAASIVGI